MHRKRTIFFSGVIITIIVGVFSLADFTAAASNTFPFVGRGMVKGNHPNEATLDVHFTHMSAQARALALGTIVTVNVGQATIQKPDARGRLVRVRQGNIAVGDEVSITGNVRSDDRFVARKVMIRKREFVMRGALKTFDYANHRLTVDVTSSSFRPTTYKNVPVTLQFTDATRFFSGGVAVSPRDVTATKQNVRLEGRVYNADDFEVITMTELAS